MNFESLFEQAANKFRKYITAEVIPAKKPICYNPDRAPFDNHIYLSFLLRDEDKDVDKLLLYFLDPSYREFARVVNEMKKVEVEEFASCLSPDVLRHQFVVDGFPVRFTASYDIAEQVTRINMDMMIRHVGNFYRTIIHGPLHSHKMPFYTDPAEGVFEYEYLPAKSYNYKESYDTGEVDLDGDPIMDSRYLPGLEDITPPTHRHCYRVQGDYCFYTGEDLV